MSELQAGQTQSYFQLEVSSCDGLAETGNLSVVVTPLVTGVGQLVVFQACHWWTHADKSLLDAMPTLVETIDVLTPPVPTTWLVRTLAGKLEFLVRESPDRFSYVPVRSLRPGIAEGSLAALSDYFGDDARITISCLDRHAN